MFELQSTKILIRFPEQFSPLIDLKTQQLARKINEEIFTEILWLIEVQFVMNYSNGKRNIAQVVVKYWKSDQINYQLIVTPRGASFFRTMRPSWHTFHLRLHNKCVIEASEYKNKCLYLLLLDAAAVALLRKSERRNGEKQPTLTSRVLKYACT